MSAASELVRDAILSAIKKTPSQSSRATKVKQIGQEILHKVGHGDPGTSTFNKFSNELVKCLQQHIRSVTSRLRSTTSKRERLWSTFHTLRTSNTLASMWKALVSSLGVPVDDPLLEQSVYQEVFESCVQDYFSSTNSARKDTEDKDLDITLSADEMNVIRYVGGYVARSLLKKHEKRNGDKHSQFIVCLGEMAVEGEGEDMLTYTRHWFDLVNRGGLYPINDVTVSLFTNIEICVRALLPRHVITCNSDKETFKANVHDEVFKNEEVQFHWTLLSQDIVSPEDAETLLQEIISLWVTIRGYSLAASWMEIYKSNEKKNTQKSTGLRKSISGT